jgi:hypothetical protein
MARVCPYQMNIALTQVRYSYGSSSASSPFHCIQCLALFQTQLGWLKGSSGAAVEGTLARSKFLVTVRTNYPSAVRLSYPGAGSLSSVEVPCDESPRRPTAVYAILDLTGSQSLHRNL